MVTIIRIPKIDKQKKSWVDYHIFLFQKKIYEYNEKYFLSVALWIDRSIVADWASVITSLFYRSMFDFACKG